MGLTPRKTSLDYCGLYALRINEAGDVLGDALGDGFLKDEVLREPRGGVARPSLFARHRQVK